MQSWIRRSLMALAVFTAFLFGSSAAALACSHLENQHCYSITTWHMVSPSEVLGGEAYILAYYGDVPNWNSGDFITNELWVDFPKMNADAWVEGGLAIGEQSATSTNYFTARSYNSSNYVEHVYPTGPGYNTWMNLYLDQHAPWPRGTWCAVFNPGLSPEYCYAGFPGSSTELQTGLEYAANTSSGAYNNGVSVGWAQWTNGEWREEWNDPRSHAVPERNLPLCINVPASGYTWGSVAFSYVPPGC